MAELTVLEEKLAEVAGLAMATKAATEVSSLGHWSVLRKLNERARRDDVGQLVEWALPIHSSATSRTCSTAHSSLPHEDPNEPS